MSQVSRNTVRAWFETGDRPTQAQFWDWIDSVVWYDEASVYRKIDADNYIVVSSDYVLSVNNGVNDWSIMLPNPAGITGKVYIIKRYDNTSTGGLVVVSEEGLIQHYSGAFLISVAVYPWGSGGAYPERIMFMSNGTNWEYIN